jgi:hypothetical protein
MMYGKRSYDYFKIFFHRPIWTELNVLFWKFLSITGIILLLLTLLSVRYYNKYPVHRIKYQLKQTYLSRIVSFYGNVEIPSPVFEEPDYSATLPETPLPEILLTESMAEETEETEAQVAREATVSRAKRSQRNAGGNAAPQITSNVPDQKKGYDPSMVKGLSGSNQTGASMQEAIGSIASAVKPSEAKRHSPMEPYNTRKKAYESSVNELARADNENIDIAESQFTDFDIATGVRDYEQTITTANENKKYVKHCIDRYYRNDPTFRGNMVVKFDIHPEGYVVPQSIRVIESDIEDTRVLNCIKRTIRRWRNFPRVPYELGEYSITQKYVF